MQLESIIRTIPAPFNLQAELRFSFAPSAMGGNADESWQALLIVPPSVLCDYGATIEEAARRVLDRFQHPDRYPSLPDE